MIKKEFLEIKKLFDREVELENRLKHLREIQEHKLPIYADKQSTKISSYSSLRGEQIEVSSIMTLITEEGFDVAKLLIDKYDKELKEIRIKLLNI